MIDGVVPTHADAPAPNPKSRLVARFIAEVQMAAVVTLVDAIVELTGKPIIFDRAMMMALVLRACPDFRCESSGLARPGAESEQPISINAIAASLGRPFETVRRHVNGLIAEGMCERTPRGIIPATSVQETPVMRLAIRRLHDLMVRLIDYAHRHKVEMPPMRASLPYHPSATVAATLDLVLASVEYLHPYYDDWLEMAVVNAAMAANARRITFDPVLSERYAAIDAIPPRSFRRPISVTQLAHALRMPYSTVQRQVKASINRGQLERVLGGVRVTDQQLTAAGVRIAGPVAVTTALRTFGRLVPGGFRFDDPASCYLDGPPALLDFGADFPD